MNTKNISYILILGILLLAPAAKGSGPVLVLSASDQETMAVAKGFKSVFGDGYKEINLQGSDERQRVIGEELKAAKPEVAIVVGDLASQMAKWYLTDVPIIYCDSVRAAKLKLNAENAVGVYHEPDSLTQLNMMRELFPDKNTVGLVYCPEYVDVREAELKQAALDLGITLEIEPMRDIRQVPDKLRTLIPKIDLLWVFTDPAVLSQYSIEYLVLQAISSGKPIFCGNRGLAQAGATAALVPDMEDVGIKAAQEARQLLSDKPVWEPGTLVYPRGKLILNLKTAHLLNVYFTPEACKNADQLIE